MFGIAIHVGYCQLCLIPVSFATWICWGCWITPEHWSLPCLFYKLRMLYSSFRLHLQVTANFCLNLATLESSLPAWPLPACEKRRHLLTHTLCQAGTRWLPQPWTQLNHRELKSLIYCLMQMMASFSTWMVNRTLQQNHHLEFRQACQYSVLYVNWMLWLGLSRLTVV